MNLEELAVAILDNSCSNPSDKFTGYNVYRVELHCAIATIHASKRSGEWHIAAVDWAEC